MAFTYGSVTKCKVANGQTRNEYECRLGYEVQSQSIANNTSSVKLRLQVRSISSNYKSYGYNQTTTIDGTALSAKEFDMRSTNTWQTFGERTITVTHNTNGSYSASKSGSFTTTASSGYSLKSGSASVTVAPATIPRYFSSTPTISVTSKTTTSVTINWTTPENCSTVQYKIGDGSWVDVVADANSKSGSYTITGLSSDTNYIIYGDFKRRDSGLWAQIKPSVNVTTYAKTIPTVSVSSKTETSVTVSSSSNVAVSSTRYRMMREGGGYGSWQTSDTFSGLYANTTYTVQVEKVGQASGEAGYATVDVTTYDYPYCTSATDFTIGNVLTLNFYNPLNRTMSVKVIGNDGSTIGGWTGNGTSISGFNDPDGIQNQYKSIPNSTFGYFKVQVTYGEVTHTRDVGNRYYIIGTEYPVFNGFIYEDINPKTLDLTGNSQILINNYSNLKVTIPVNKKAYSNYHSPIDKYRLNVGNMTSVEANYSDTEDVSMSINSINSSSITVTAIDKRGLSQPFTMLTTYKAYFKPIIKSMAAVRGDGGVGSQVTLSFDGELWNDNFGAVANSIKNIEYYYKKTTDTTWTKGNISIIPTISGNNFSGSILIEGPNADDKGFDVSTSYNIKMSVTDELDTSNEYQIILGTGTPAIAIYNNKVAIGQKYDEDLGGALQVKGEVIEQGLRVSPTYPETNDMVWIQKGKNLFNINTMVELFGKFRPYDTVGIIASNDVVNGIKFPVEPNSTYTFSSNSSSNSNIVFYDKNFNYISGNAFIEEKTFTTPDNCYYVTMAVVNNYTWIQIEQGSTATEYEAYVDKKIWCKNDNGVFEEFYDESKMNKTNYSTEEQVIGTWFGKPLYRKIFTGTTNSNPYVILGILNDCETLFTRGRINDITGNQNSINVYWDDNLRNICQLVAHNELALTYGSAFQNCDYNIITEYTKTTD